MRIKRLTTLLSKEFFQGPKNFFFIWALVAPISISLVVSLVFGSLFDHEASLGFVDEGDSKLATMLIDSSSVNSSRYDSISDLQSAVENGAVDGGLVIPSEFDSAVLGDQPVEVDFYLWGESLAKDRTLLSVTLSNLVRDLAGKEPPVEVLTETLGDEEEIPWEDRLLPFIVLMTVFIAGIALPGSSLLNEKEKKTIDALVVTPTTIGDIFLAKGILGVVMGFLMGIIILIINQAMGNHPVLLLLLLALGATMASATGLLMASLFKNTMTVF